MNAVLKKLLLDELHIAVLPEKEGCLNETSLTEAVTMNENLKTMYGYTFLPADLVKIASSGFSAELFSSFSDMIPEVKAAPMYPDFPSQVMDISEAQFRFHQAVYYFSTYGIERLTGYEVLNGWLPETESTEKTEADENLLAAKVLELIPEEKVYYTAYRRILSRRERMTLPEQQIAAECTGHLSEEELTSVKVSFKENLIPIFTILMDQLKGEKRINTIHAVCQNTGDVFKCAPHYFDRYHWHLRTSQKRAFVKIFESYPVRDFRDNLMHSRAKREDVLKVLQFIDFNSFVRSDDHRDAVINLRMKRMRSWEGELKEILKRDPEEALEYTSRRPGELLRKTAWLMRSGVSGDAIEAELKKSADSLSTQTLVSLCRTFSTCTKDEDNLHKAELFRIFIHVLGKKLTGLRTPVYGKRVYIDEESFDLAHSVIETNDKSAEGGYIRSGLAFRIPENVGSLRFFTYWNDKERVDIDLHAKAFNSKGDAFHIGWLSEFRGKGLVSSGDITHSNAAEYIDIDLAKAPEHFDHVSVQINSFTGKRFRNIDEVLVGMMAVSRIGTKKNVRLYNPANCFFSHELRSNTVNIAYGHIDLKARVLVFAGKENRSAYDLPLLAYPVFTAERYLQILLECQKAELTADRENADVILKMTKAENEREISLIDQNWFLDERR